MATPIRIKRSAVPNKKPTKEQLQLGELAVNFYDGKVFFKQDTNGVGIGTRIVEIGAGSTTFAGKTLYVTSNGNDENTGLDDKNAKATIKAAVALAFPGDTVKVLPGTYIENNPINLLDNVSIEGAELRRCLVQPQNSGEHLFYIGQGNHITDLSFVGAASTNGAAVFSYRPLLGTASDRFFDAARLIRQNLDFIAQETVGYITSTDYKNPAISIDSTNCADDIKDVYRAVCHDITRGGNSKSIGAGKSYFDINGNLDHIVGFGTTTIDAFNYSIGIARSCVNNISWTGNYQSRYSQIGDLSIQEDGVTGSNQDYGSCANVHSAITICVGIVTGIIQNGIDGLSATTGFTTNYPGNNGTINSGILTATLSPLQGTGVITKGPYIRNCTNFIPNSIGAKIDGFNSDPGDQLNPIGVQGSFNVDSYTQYNQGGIGVSVTNGAYAQLVSLFTICDDTAVYTGGGGQCDLTNSNSSFGTKGLVSQGVGDQTSRCIDRYTGEVFETVAQLQNIVTVSGIGNNRPYSGQVIYFGKIYYQVDDIIVSSGGTGYINPPVVTIDSPTGLGVAVNATSVANISNGSVTSIDIISNGTQYEEVPTVTVSSPDVGINTATAIAVLRPIYYGVDSATEPISGVSTITLKTNLNNEVGTGTTVFFARQSFQIVSSHSFQYIGAGNTIETAYPSRGGVTIQENEVVKMGGGEIVYTSTDQDGNFRIGDGVVIDQSTGSITGDVYVRSLFSQVTPFILALGGD
jgi:hypothetical protein